MAVLNTLMLLILYPGVLPTGPIYNLIAVISMLLGVETSVRIIRRTSKYSGTRISVVLYTLTAGIARTLVMTLVNWIFLPYPPPVGFDMPTQVVLGLLPVIGFFNLSVVLYTVPLSLALEALLRKSAFPHLQMANLIT